VHRHASLFTARLHFPNPYRNLASSIQNFTFRNLQSAICNLKSAIPHPKAEEGAPRKTSHAQDEELLAFAAIAVAIRTAVARSAPATRAIGGF